MTLRKSRPVPPSIDFVARVQRLFTQAHPLYRVSYVRTARRQLPNRLTHTTATYWEIRCASTGLSQLATPAYVDYPAITCPAATAKQLGRVAATLLPAKEPARDVRS